MTTKMNINFEAKVYKDGLSWLHTVPAFWSLIPRRYRVQLFADGLPTKLIFTNLNKREAENESKLLAEYALEALEYHGSLEQVWSAVLAQRAFTYTGLRVGDWIRLKEGVAGLTKDQWCQVQRIDLNDDATDIDDHYPLMVSPGDPKAGLVARGIKVPVQMDEVQRTSVKEPAK